RALQGGIFGRDRPFRNLHRGRRDPDVQLSRRAGGLAPGRCGAGKRPDRKGRALGAILAGAIAEGATDMTIRIGANPIGWSNDDMPELGGDTPLETCLQEARDVGFEGMELGRKFPRTPDALRAALAPFGLACISGWYSASLLQRD